VKFGKSDKIQFISTVKGLETFEECLPRPAKHFIPKWFKDIPSRIGGTVKDCPSFPDYFSEGYILPMWSDVTMNFLHGEPRWELSARRFNWETHANMQLMDYVTPNVQGVDAQFVFKADCPWRIITPPGWSVLQLPLFYHFNQEWSVLPGIVDTDIHSIINQQVLYHGNGKEIKINCGDPFVLYIPFKRSNKLKHEVRYQTEKEIEDFDLNLFNFRKRFVPNGYYRELQRKRDKGV
jgi:hypothetical protein